LEQKDREEELVFSSKILRENTRKIKELRRN
jgi:hypothetical protein